MFCELDNRIYEILSKKNAKHALLSAIVLGIVAHAYTYFNATLFHDRSTYFMYPVFNSVIRTKWFAQFVDCMTCFAYLPWLIGAIVIICDAIAVFFIAEALEIKNAVAVWVITGLTITNDSYIGAHFYWAHEIIAALPFICASVYIWCRNKDIKVRRVLCEVVLISLCMAEYGAYATLGTSLVIVICFFWIMNGEECKCILSKGVEYVISFILGTVFYYILLRLLLKYQHYELLSYGGENRLMMQVKASEMWTYVCQAYIGGFKMILQYRTIPHVLESGFMVCAVVMLVFYILERYRNIKDIYSVVLLFFLIFILPLSIGGIYVMSFGHVHFLMEFTGVTWMIMLVKVIDENGITVNSGRIVYVVHKATTGLVGVALISTIYFGVLKSNLCYSRLDQMFNNTISEGIGLANKIESCKGFLGNERIVLVGNSFQTEYYMKNRVVKEWLGDMLLALASDEVPNGFTYNGCVPSILSEVIGVNQIFEWYDRERFSDSENEMVNNLPEYPAQGSIVKFEDKIFIKGKMEP